MNSLKTQEAMKAKLRQMQAARDLDLSQLQDLKRHLGNWWWMR